MAWRWDNGVQRYRNENGRFLSRETALIWAMDSMDAASDVTASLARLVANNEISADDWRDLMRQEIKDENIRQYLSTMGGREMMTQSDWGTVGNLIKEQYGYLENFYNSVQAGELSESAIAARAAMYMRAAREAHERGHAKGRGLPPNSLPGYPGDGKTVCLCITTPLSKVLTKRGWVPLIDIEVGDQVFTHEKRWKRVTAKTVKPSQPYHRQIFIRMPGGEWVGATHDHRWYTPNGWVDSTDMGNQFSMVYHLPFEALHSEVNDGQILQDVQQSPVKSKQSTLPPLQEEGQIAEILFAGMLPPGTPLYDITVEDDHSFVIEGLFAHNTNCGCTWRIVTVRNRQNEIIRWDCHWTLNPALENCPDCLERAGEWNPYVVSPPSGERDISKKRIRIILPETSLRRDVVALDIFSSPVE